MPFGEQESKAHANSKLLERQRKTHKQIHIYSDLGDANIFQ